MIALLLFGIGLYVIGSIMERGEKRKRDEDERQAWEDFDRRFPGYRASHR